MLPDIILTQLFHKEKRKGESKEKMLGFNLSWDTMSPVKVFPLPYLAAESPILSKRSS